MHWRDLSFFSCEQNELKMQNYKVSLIVAEPSESFVILLAMMVIKASQKW